MKLQFECLAPLSKDFDRAVFLSQGRIKSETKDIALLQDAYWLAKNYFD